MKEWVARLNKFGREQIPCFFLIDFEQQKVIVDSIDNASKHGIEWKLQHSQVITNNAVSWEVIPVDKRVYDEAFQKVLAEIHFGNTYLLNLTFPSSVKTNLDLESLFSSAQARYKVMLKNRFCSFSPESFVKIKDNYISSSPMKGTIDADIPDAAYKLLNDPKETAEHYTIVDLIRNDLNIVADKVIVKSFQYLEEVITNKGRLLQMSSLIQGELDAGWPSRLGEIFDKLLPAGSISGAPKRETLRIIREVELDKRGYYTGVFGVFDGRSVDSCVLIRYVENDHDKGLVYRSGGGITFMSVMESEYEELIKKVYAPVY